MNEREEHGFAVDAEDCRTLGDFLDSKVVGVGVVGLQECVVGRKRRPCKVSHEAVEDIFEAAGER